MLVIDKQTRGRFGNKVFHYNTLVQVSSILDQKIVCADWDASNVFKDIKTSGSVCHEDFKEIPCFDLINLTEEELKEKYSEGTYKLHSLSLCGPFFRIVKKDPREFIKLKETIDLSHSKSVGIHIRGGDIRGADGNMGREIHSPDYYINAIDFVLEEHNNDVSFYLCTDDADENYPSYKKTLDYLLSKKVILDHNPSNHYVKDFTILSECEILIAGSSTFVTAAGMIGTDKKIIHSKDFVEQFKDEDQKWYSNFGNGIFFHDMNHMKSDYYNVWKLI